MHGFCSCAMVQPSSLANALLALYFKESEERLLLDAMLIGKWRTVFDIGGNKYRLVVDMRYDLGRIYIRHLLTHEEYDRRTRDGSL